MERMFDHERLKSVGWYKLEKGKKTRVINDPSGQPHSHVSTWWALFSRLKMIIILYALQGFESRD